MERKLAAILSADVAGYSRLIEHDDEATIGILTASRELIVRSVGRWHGRVIDAPGDNLLAEFGSVVDAVRCAVEVQQSLHERNAAAPEAQRMLFRIGINVGDVVVQSDHLYGDGVNIAARLEALAEPGGICVSGNVFAEIEHRIDVDFEFIGERHLKNITKPVAVWRARLRAEDTGHDSAGIGSALPDREKKLRFGIVIPALLGATVIGAASLGLMLGTAPPAPGTSSQQMQGTSIAETSERPALIVLPFSNISNEPGQDYLSDGITEDITTDLAKLDSIFVVSSNDAFRFKGKSVESAGLKAEFGVRYMLEGSVRKTDDHVRVTARLIDVKDDKHLWSERYDRPFTDIFAVQDEIRGKILTALRVKLTTEEQRRFSQAPTDNLEAYDFYLRAIELTHRARRELRPELMSDAAAFLEQAIELDPSYAAAIGRLGLTYWLSWFYRWSDDGHASVERSLRLFEKALVLDPSNPHALRFIISALIQTRQFDAAVAAAEQYVMQLPQNPVAHRMKAFALAYQGELQAALASVQHSTKLNPDGIVPPYAQWIYGALYFLLDQHEEAVSILRRATLHSPNYLTNHIILTAVLSEMGQAAEARAQAQEILRISPRFSSGDLIERLPFRDTQITERFIVALRRADVP